VYAGDETGSQQAKKDRIKGKKKLIEKNTSNLFRFRLGSSGSPKKKEEQAASKKAPRT